MHSTDKFLTLKNFIIYLHYGNYVTWESFPFVSLDKIEVFSAAIQIVKDFMGNYYQHFKLNNISFTGHVIYKTMTQSRHVGINKKKQCTIFKYRQMLHSTTPTMSFRKSLFFDQGQI